MRAVVRRCLVYDMSLTQTMLLLKRKDLTLLKGLLHTIVHFFSLDKSSVSSSQLSYLWCFRSFHSRRTALRLCWRPLHMLSSHLSSVVEGPPGSLPGQVLPREAGGSHPRSLGSSLHLHCACAPSPGREHRWNLARSLLE